MAAEALGNGLPGWQAQHQREHAAQIPASSNHTVCTCRALQTLHMVVMHTLPGGVLRLK
jgi:hypothetical protein